MNEPMRHGVPLFDQLQESISGKAHTSRDGANFHWYQAIVHDLESVRARLDESIISCAQRESQFDQIETEDGWRFAHHHLTEIDSLGGLRNHLDRVLTRFRASFTARVVPEVSGSARRIDLELAECAKVMIRRFEHHDARHDFQADLASDLCRFERLLDELALLHLEGEHGLHQGGVDRARGEHAADRVDPSR